MTRNATPKRIKREQGLGEFDASPVTVRVGTIERASHRTNIMARDARSGAPSVDTFRNHTAQSVVTHEEDEPVFMQTRQRRQPADEASTVNASFVTHVLPFENMAMKLKNINDAFCKLQTLGIQHVVSLPEIVLIGDQSAGKSSLMSALAGLNLPQSAGTCTRCPMHIRLSRAAEWCCRVSLHINYAFKPGSRTITAKDVNNAHPFPPWEKTAWDVQHFKTIRNPQDSIEAVLKWAQLAILNPSQRPEMYVPRDPEEDEDFLPPQDGLPTEAQFSPNTIALEITGPNLPDLSFYDLPGIFTNPGRVEDQYLVKVVQNLTKEYISHENALILWALPMNADPETSCSFSLIRSSRNAVERVLGVMTKADLLPKGNDQRWISILDGKAHKTGLGYFITSRPDKHDLAEQEASEEAFFNRQVLTDMPWPESFRPYAERCGVTKLKDFLSQKLAAEFNKSLPVVKQKVQLKQTEVETALNELPELPPNPELEVRQGLARFTELVKAYLNDQNFSQDWKLKQDKFTRRVLSLKPIYKVKPADSGPVVVDLCDDDDSGSPQPGPDMVGRRQKRRADGTVIETPHRHRTIGPNVKGEDSPSVAFGLPPTFAVGPIATPFRQKIGGPLPGPLPKRTLAEVRELIHAHRRHGIPDDVPIGVKSFLCLEAIDRWNHALGLFLSDTMNLLHAVMKRALDTALAGLRQRHVYREASKHLVEFINGHGAALKDQLQTLYNLEAYQIYSINPRIFEKNRQTERRRLVRVRHHYRWSRHNNREPEPQTLPNFDTMTEEEQAAEEAQIEKEAGKMAKDDMRLEIELCAWVRGYFLTAAGRFTENVALYIISGIFPAIQQTVNFHIDKKLGLLDGAGRDVFEALMEEEAGTTAKREMLKSERDKYAAAMATIRQLEESAGMAVDDEDDRASMNSDVMAVDGFDGHARGAQAMTPPSMTDEEGVVRRTLFT